MSKRDKDKGGGTPAASADQAGGAPPADVTEAAKADAEAQAAADAEAAEAAANAEADAEAEAAEEAKVRAADPTELPTGPIKPPGMKVDNETALEEKDEETVEMLLPKEVRIQDPPGRIRVFPAGKTPVPVRLKNHPYFKAHRDEVRNKRERLRRQGMLPK